MRAVAETPEFQAQARKLLTEEEVKQLITLLAKNPKAGDVMPGTGGFRKLRFARTAGGKSGGYRVIYFYYNEDYPVLLVSIYAKNAKENVTASERNQLAAIAAKIKHHCREK